VSLVVGFFLSTSDVERRRIHVSLFCPPFAFPVVVYVVARQVLLMPHMYPPPNDTHVSSS
jgi:hypothetical protein